MRNGYRLTRQVPSGYFRADLGVEQLVGRDTGWFLCAPDSGRRWTGRRMTGHAADFGKEYGALHPGCRAKGCVKAGQQYEHTV